MPEIHLSEQDERFIEEQVAAGVYSDADAAIHASLQLLSSDERKRVARKLLIEFQGNAGRRAISSIPTW